MDNDFEKSFLQEMMREVKELAQTVYTLREEVNHLKANSSIRRNIFIKILTAILIAGALGVFTWVGDLLYKAPSPTQQTLLNNIQDQIKKHHSY